MMATYQEDVQSVLEQFVENVANLPAEIAHISEEMAAKDKRMSELRNQIAQKDTSIQRFIKQNGSNVINSKETTYTSIILNAFKEAEQLQEEKCALAKKAKDLITKHIKRLDTKIKDLQNEGLIPNDPIIPVQSAAANSSAAQQSKDNSRRNSISMRGSPMPGASGHGRSQSTHNSTAATPGGASGTGSTTPTIGQVVSHLNSALGHDQKRRRLANGTASSVPAVPSLLSQSNTVSQGAGTPNSTGNAPARTLNAPGARRQAPPKTGRKGGPVKRKPHTDDDEDEDTEGGTSHEVEEEEDNGEDQRLYCTCQQVSYGNMVACDDPECPFEWFHWSCVGLQKEPVGKWFCDHCTNKRKKDKKEQSS